MSEKIRTLKFNLILLLCIILSIEYVFAVDSYSLSTYQATQPGISSSGFYGDTNYDSVYGNNFYSGSDSNLDTYSQYGASNSYNLRNQYYSSYQNSYPSSTYGSYPSSSYGYGRYYQPFPSQAYLSGQNPSIDLYSTFNESQCGSGQDFLIQVMPFGCSPSVVRSDLLESQNVPVFCQLAATKLNPLIDIDAIYSMDFTKREQNENIVGIGFHPARAALRQSIISTGTYGGFSSRSGSLLNSPILNNVGYAVIVIKQQLNEKSMPDTISGNLTAVLRYDLKNAFGIGAVEYAVSEVNEETWSEDYKYYSFWNGKGYLRADTVDVDRAIISLMSDQNHKVDSIALRVGETSKEIRMPGFYCLAKANIKLEKVSIPDTTARIRIDESYIDLVSGQRFLDDKCKVNVVEKNGLFEFVQIQCNTDDYGLRYFDFSKSPGIVLNVGGISNTYKIGDVIPISNGQNRYYIAGVDTNIQTGKQSVLFDTSTTYSPYRRYQSTYSGYNSFLYENNNLRVDIGSEIMIGTNKIIFEELSEGINEDFSVFADDSIINQYNSKFKENFENAIKDYNRLSGDFAFEKVNPEYTGSKSYGEVALIEASDLASQTGQVLRSKELLSDLRDKFSETNSNEINKLIDESEFYSQQETRAIIVDGRTHVITFLGSKRPSISEFSADISVRDAGTKITSTYQMGKDEYREIGLTNNLADKIILRYVDDISIDIDYIGGDVNSLGTSRQSSQRLTILRGSPLTIGNYTIYLTNTNVKKVAYVRITPKLENIRSEANFSYNIGIEKRAIELSPQKTEERMSKVNDTLETLNKLSKTLGDVVKFNKAACLATGGVLITKNLLSNLGGTQIARQAVMRSQGGWTEFCRQQVAEGNGEYASIDDCFRKNAPEIDADVQILHEFMQKQNEDIKSAKGTTGGSILGNEFYNHDEYLKNYLPGVRNDLDNCGQTIVDPTNSNRVIQTTSIRDTLTPEFEDKGGFYVEQARDVQLYCRLINSEDVKGTRLENIAKQKLYDTANNIQETTSDLVAADSLKGQFLENGFDKVSVHSYGSRKSIKGIYSGQDVLGRNIIGVNGLEPDKNYHFEPITYNNEKYVLLLDEQGGGEYSINSVYKYESVSGGKINVKPLDENSGASEIALKSHFNGFTKYDENSFNNPYKKPEAKFYESEPYKGFPAVVPFDINRGWYAATKQTVGAFGNIASYDDSGRVSSFWLCNVGNNGLEEFETGYGDDHCQQINIGTGQPYGEVLGLADGEANRLVGRAIRAIESASNQRQSNPNLKSLSIEGRTISVGEPAVNIPQVQCQDFMSPKDCQLMFNVCDPVICPSSRCDLGGNYRVPNVIQSGIVGSIALCLPNYKEGIAVPICLSGVNAGVQGLESVYQNYYDCLEESLATGRQTGICDEIHSIYLCDFFWRQAAPVAKIGIPKIMGSLLGEGSRGGGEYLGVKSAWDNAESSVTYFTQSYAENSYNAFKVRSTDEVGSAVCKSFVSMRYPDLIENMIEPDSPVQYHAWFDEIPFTSATVPATSQYKVFYHIFAGKDVGSYFEVYIKSASGISFYETPGRFIVASGYIERGGYKSDTIEFTQVAGYKELCVSVNAQEECGFAKVSTSFALDYLKDKYLEEQASSTGITSESECVSGQASVYSLANPNLQEGVNDVINPQLYNYGIVRVCSTENPGNYNDAGAGTEEARWRAVGNCDGSLGKVKCWVDSKSIKENIDIKYLEENALDQVSENYLELLEGEGGNLNRNEVKELIEKIESKQISDEETIKEIDAKLSYVVYSDQKAYLILLRARAYRNKAVEDYSKIRDRLEVIEPGREVSLEVREETSTVPLDQSGCEEIKTSATSLKNPEKIEVADQKEIIDGLLKCGYITQEQYDSFEDNFVDKFMSIFGANTRTTFKEVNEAIKETEEIKNEDIPKSNKLTSVKLTLIENSLILNVDHDCEKIKYEIIGVSSGDNKNVIKTETSEDKSFTIPVDNTLKSGKYYAIAYCLNANGNVVIQKISGTVDIGKENVEDNTD